MVFALLGEWSDRQERGGAQPPHRAPIPAVLHPPPGLAPHAPLRAGAEGAPPV